MIKPKAPRILFYDIETSPLRAWVWRMGDQTVRHNQLDTQYDKYGIICIAYCFNDGKPPKVIGWGYEEQSTEAVVAAFDEIIKTADITIGKNNRRFDVKHINAQRWFAGLPPMPNWATIDDDLESQMRKHFALPSQSLDYVSKIKGYGGKTKMEFQDWIDIVEKRKKASYKKMLDYCKKDVSDTRSLWFDIEPYVTPKINMAKYLGNQDGNYLRCKHCGSADVVKNGIAYTQAVPKQRFHCPQCKTAAGRAAIRADGKLGKME